jgi:hypothetical protein
VTDGLCGEILRLRECALLEYPVLTGIFIGNRSLAPLLLDLGNVCADVLRLNTVWYLEWY